MVGRVGHTPDELVHLSVGDYVGARGELGPAVRIEGRLAEDFSAKNLWHLQAEIAFIADYHGK